MKSYSRSFYNVFIAYHNHNPSPVYGHLGTSCNYKLRTYQHKATVLTKQVCTFGLSQLFIYFVKH